MATAEEGSLRPAVMTALAWIAGFRYIGQAISWLCFILVVRMLAPGDFGLMAEASLTIGFFAMMGELGVGAALVQKRDLTSVHIKQNFGFLLMVNGALLLVLVVAAPMVASYFKEPRLTIILQTQSMVFMLMGLYAIPQSALMRALDFKTSAAVEFVASLSSSAVTLLAAYLGHGVWALVWGSLALHGMLAIGYNVTAGQGVWPSFSLRGMKQFVSFGGYVTGERIVWYLHSKADIFIGGRFLASHALGLYSIAMSIASLPLDKLSPILNQVAFPAYAKIQDDIRQAGAHFLKSFRLFSLVVFPVCGGLIVTAPELTHLALGEKWDAVIVPLQILSASIPLRTMATLYSPALNGLGQPKVSFGNVLVACAILVPAFLFGAWAGSLEGICWAWLIGFLVVFLVVSWRSLPVLRLSMIDCFLTFLFPCVATIAMVVSLQALKHYLVFQNEGGTLALKVLVGAGLYGGLVVLFRRELVHEILHMVRKR